MKKYLAANVFHIILLFVSIILFVTYLQQYYIIIPQLSNMPMVDEIMKAKLLEGYYKYRWLMFLTPIAILLIRVSLVALCLFIGNFFIVRQYKMKYVDSWNIALKSDVILILFSVIVCIIVIDTSPEYMMKMVRYNSLAFLVNPDITAQWLLVPIAALNIFEICYCFFMAKLMAILTGDSYRNSFKFVLSTYGVGYLFYIVFLMYLLLYLA